MRDKTKLAEMQRQMLGKNNPVVCSPNKRAKTDPDFTAIEWHKSRIDAGLEQPDCRCGRPADRPHCAVCGGATIFAMSTRSYIKPIECGTEIAEMLVMAYRCRRCGSMFDDMDWIKNCEALAKPISARKAALIRQATASIGSLSPESPLAIDLAEIIHRHEQRMEAKQAIVPKVDTTPLTAEEQAQADADIDAMIAAPLVQKEETPNGSGNQ